LPHAEIDGLRWLWPAGEDPAAERWREDPEGDGRLRLLAPFDPVVWDRLRFELLWGWAYRFEAYTPAARRKLGYYALPLLWRDRVVGWANVSVDGGQLRHEVGFAGRAVRGAGFERALEEELQKMRGFLGR
jgi:uncharacterized protein YcaQ